MQRDVRSVYWEAPEHFHIEKTGDWYWIFGIFAIAGSISSIIFGNILFGIVIILGTTVMMLYAHHPPRIINFEISGRGIRVEDTLYPYSTLESFFIDEDHRHGPQLIVKSKKLLSQFLIIPIPEENSDEIETILASRLYEEHLEEPIAHKLLEIFGF